MDFYSSTIQKVFDKCADGSVYAENAVVPEVMYKMNNSPVTKLYDIDDNFVNRIVMIGRRGSGRETQAKMLAERYNLVYSMGEVFVCLCTRQYIYYSFA